MALEQEKKDRHDDLHDTKKHRPQESHPGLSTANDPAGHAAVSRMTHGGTKDLGHLDKPGAVLAHKKEVLAPGQTLRFATSVNQIWGLGEPTIEPAEGLDYVGRELAPNKRHELGSQSLQQYNFTMGKHVKSGTHFKVSFPGHYQVQHDPHWHFSFTIVCA